MLDAELEESVLDNDGASMGLAMSFIGDWSVSHLCGQRSTRAGHEAGNRGR